MSIALNLTPPCADRPENPSRNLRIVGDPPTTPTAPYGQFPHGIASDVRLSPTGRLMGMALLHWAWTTDRCTVATWRLADYLGVSVPTAERALAELDRHKLIARDRVPYTARNMTGRSIRLLWVGDPSILQRPPLHDAPVGQTRPVAPCNHPSPVMDYRPEMDTEQNDRIHHGRGEGSITGEGEGPSRAMDKEKGERIEKKRRQTDSSRKVSSSSAQVVSRRREAQKESDPPEAVPEVIAVQVSHLAPEQGDPSEPVPLKAVGSESPIADRLAAVVEHAVAAADQPQIDGPEAQPEPKANPSRSALIVAIKLIAQGNPEVRRALLDAAANMLKTAKLAGSTTPYDHVRMAFEKSAANKKRRDSIESLAWGILKNWTVEGLPAVNAPEPPGRSKRREIPDVPQVIVDRRAEAVVTDAANAAIQVRWTELTQEDRDRITATVEQSNPDLIRFKHVIMALCHNMMESKYCNNKCIARGD